MLYADLIREPLRVRVSNYIIRFGRHFDQYANSTLIRSVDLNDVVWC